MFDEEKKVTVELERHQWPDEIEQKKKTRKNELLASFFAIVILVIIFFVGFTAGKNSQYIVNRQSTNNGPINKLESVLSTLVNDWYFATEFDDVENELIDQALYGMTTNDVDLHTDYFSADELESFTQSMNMSFVGIGVQYVELEEGFIVEKVFRNSPAERYGVQAGDIFYRVDGKLVSEMETDEIRDRVRGEIGTTVVIEFLRQGEIVELSIVRDKINGTAYAEMVDDSIGYLEIDSFGETTAEEVKNHLEYLSAQGMTSLIIDLRDNGGGYLDTFLNMAGFFIGKNEVAIQQQYNDGKVVSANARGDKFENIEKIVVLINENTASASEVLAIALKEQRDDVTIVGVTSYGKGTVQNTLPYLDGSALKYTTSEWLSPYGTSIHGVGITPDVEVKVHDILYQTIPMEEEFTYRVDQVSYEIEVMQKSLDFLNYNVSRQDGYFNLQTELALKKFQKDHQLTADGVLDQDVMMALRAAVIREWNLNDKKDTQYYKALELAR